MAIPQATCVGFGGWAVFGCRSCRKTASEFAVVPSSTAAANRRSCASRGRSGQTFSAACPNIAANRFSLSGGDVWKDEPSDGVLCGGAGSRVTTGTVAGAIAAGLACAFSGQPAISDDFRHDLLRRSDNVILCVHKDSL